MIVSDNHPCKQDALLKGKQKKTNKKNKSVIRIRFNQFGSCNVAVAHERRTTQELDILWSDGEILVSV